jgi:hypothetical protein
MSAYSRMKGMSSVSLSARAALGARSTGLGIRLVGPHGTMAVRQLADGVVYLESEGIAYAVFCEQLFDVVEGSLRGGGQLTLFFDASKMRSYEPEFRRQWAEWLGNHHDLVRLCVVRAHSPITRMWVDVVNVFTGGLVHAIEDRDSFRRLLHENICAAPPRAAARDVGRTAAVAP